MSDITPPTSTKLHRLTATPPDIPLHTSVLNLVNNSYRQPYNWTNESAIVSGHRITLSSLLHEMTTHEIWLLLSNDGDDDDNGVRGCVKLGVVRETVVGPIESSRGKVGYIGMLAVDARWQGQGYGSWLLGWAERRLWELGEKVVVMDVIDCRRELIEWYERSGYRRTGKTVDARGFIEGKGEKLLRDCGFTLLEKVLRDGAGVKNVKDQTIRN